MCGSLSGLCVKPSQVERSDSEKPTERLLFENSFNKLTHSNLSGSRRTNKASMFAVDLGSCDIRSGAVVSLAAHTDPALISIRIQPTGATFVTLHQDCRLSLRFWDFTSTRRELKSLPTSHLEIRCSGVHHSECGRS